MIGLIVRFVVSALVLLLVSWLVPGFEVSGFWGAVLTAIVIAIIGYLVELVFGEKISPQRRGITGFLVVAITIYLAQFIVPNYVSVTLLGALLAAVLVGVIDLFVPTQIKSKA
ncbi:MAG: phage holin family protein [Syntrophomonadaceae bacterium]|nr:phage holin family protein [Syntrophomonadaceae bacterium]